MNTSALIPQSIAEFIGTFFLVFFGCGAMILNEVSPYAMPAFLVPIIFGGTVSVMIYAVGHISGAHFNPAVTIAFNIARRFPARKVPAYIGAQVAGAVCASLLHAVIWGTEHSFGISQLQTSVGIGMGMEVLLSLALMFVIISVATDTRAVGEQAGIAIGSTVALCSYIGGSLTGASMNPARSIGPALVSGNMENIWIYLVFTVVGTIVGALIYEKIRCESEEASDHGCC